MITAERITLIPRYRLWHVFVAVFFSAAIAAYAVRWYIGTLYVLVPVDRVPGYTWTHGGAEYAIVEIGIKLNKKEKR